MEEKKLTDEEIVKALDKTKQDLANISPEDDDYDKLLTVKTIVDYCHDLIHRLQGENATLESELKKELDEHEEFTKKAKAEIERLKEKFSISHYKDSWKNKFFKAQEELERLTEEKDKYQEKWQTSYMNELNLQKQVEKLTAFKNEAISTSLYEVGRKDGEEVAEEIKKDTAKEILGVILAREFEKGDYLTDDELHELFKERYGVEVE